ncbi:alpha/beta-hydrolase [Athelia psychrophila]|uniref:Alpha/beta-hydrolase n=1 Tax=Athelia psychrophila TaxID=1759441 RepID=A0A165XYH1_9AGAM|nr:alpha/beta-hydrolase [Fibularhizoctonia sp. CBS 109695]
MVRPGSLASGSAFRAALKPNHSLLRSRSRLFSATTTPVELQYDELIPADGNKTDKPLVILHGLFGSKRNWLSLSKAFMKDLQRPIYTLDLRNHGDSPHAAPMDYPAMAADVLHFFEQRGLSNISLLGHSMGGKVAMAVALSPALSQDALTNLIVADIAPSRGDLSPEFRGYVEGMKKIMVAKVGTRKEAQAILTEYEQDASIRAFLLTNIALPTTATPHIHFRIPVPLIGDSMAHIGGFPYEAGHATWEGRAMFIKGTKSRYINTRNVALTKEYFPNMVLEELDASHWVHAEKPNEFKKLVTDFIHA